MERRTLIRTDDQLSIDDDVIVDVDRLRTTLNTRIKHENTYMRDMKSQRNRMKTDREDSTSELIKSMEKEIAATAIRIENIKTTISVAEKYTTGGRSRCF